jgi:hypothetical protein
LRKLAEEKYIATDAIIIIAPPNRRNCNVNLVLICILVMSIRTYYSIRLISDRILFFKIKPPTQPSLTGEGVLKPFPLGGN